MSEEKYYITKQAYEKLQEEYQKIKLEDKPVVLDRVKRARELGELEDNQEYEAARDAQNVIEGRIMEIEEILENCELIEEGSDGIKGRVNLGSTVTVEVAGGNQTFTIVGSIEADPSGGKISHESPVGSKLLGLKEGDDVKIELPNATIDYRIIRIHE